MLDQAFFVETWQCTFGYRAVWWQRNYLRARFTLYQVHDDAFLHTVCILSRDEKRKKYDEINNVAEYKPRASLQFSWDYFVHNMTLYVRNCVAVCNKFKIVPCLL